MTRVKALPAPLKVTAYTWYCLKCSANGTAFSMDDADAESVAHRRAGHNDEYPIIRVFAPSGNPSTPIVPSERSEDANQ